METKPDCLSLADLAVGSKCRIASLELGDLLRRRILDLGLVPGTQVRCIRKSPAGNPIAYLVRGSIIALRTEDVKKIKIYPFNYMGEEAR